MDYAWWDGDSWEQHPSDDFPGQITMSGGGRSDLVFTDEAYVALSDSSVHKVVFWDESADPDEWADLGSTLSVNGESGWMEDISLAANADGDLYVAWTENNGSDLYEVYVKARIDDADWVQLGAGKVSGDSSAINPSIALIGGSPWVAYLEDDLVYVAGWDGDSWEPMGDPLNENLAQPAFQPRIADVGGVAHVAFREEVAGVQHLFVKAFE